MCSLVVLLFVAAACGSGGSAATTSASASGNESTIGPPDPTTTTTAETPRTTAVVTTTAGPGTTSTLPDIDVEIAGGEVAGRESFEVTLGETVDLWVLSDVDDEIHVHGYDIRLDLDAGIPFNLSFVADIPGIFEVERHSQQGALFEIEVTG